MKSKMLQNLGVALILYLLCNSSMPVPAAADQGQTGLSPFDPASVGATVKTSIQCGEAYSSHEPYDVKITLLEVLRGERAWERIRASAKGSRQPKEGFDYLLARIRFEYFARGAPGNCGHELSPDQFIAYSAEGREYASPSVLPSEPILKGTIFSGQSKEGWVVLEVPQQDRRPLMTFNSEPGGGVDHGGNVWFQLK